MYRNPIDVDGASTVSTQRRQAVLESALLTFARFGFRKASMDTVARASRISRPGLYLLFNSKEELFRAAVTHALDSDLAVVEAILTDTSRPLSERLLAAFDRWAGRYIGPVACDITVMINENPGILGSVAESAPHRFADMITHAITTALPDANQARRLAVAQTLISASIGIKHQVQERTSYLQQMDVAIDLLTR